MCNWSAKKYNFWISVIYHIWLKTCIIKSLYQYFLKQGEATHRVTLKLIRTDAQCQPRNSGSSRIIKIRLPSTTENKQKSQEAAIWTDFKLREPSRMPGSEEDEWHNHNAMYPFYQWVKNTYRAGLNWVNSCFCIRFPSIILKIVMMGAVWDCK